MFNGIISSISPTSKCLKYIENRLSYDNYRGFHCSQHNRYDQNELKVILEEIDKKVGNNFMQIRTTDMSKRPNNITGEEKYADFCLQVISKVGKGTQDSIRKTLFVDFERMGLIERFNKDKVSRTKTTKYIKISELGRKFVNCTNDIERFFIFSSGINKLTSNFIDYIIDIIRETGTSNITLQEYMFFVSAINFKSNFMLSIKECIDYINDYRLLSETQKQAIDDILKEKLNPKLFTGNKTNLRDFYNWRNEARQVMMLMNQTIYFEFSKNKLYNIDKLGDGEEFTKLVRSTEQKNNYHKEHETVKTIGFELHHIVPLGSATSKEHFKILDNWKNLVYIDGHKHAIITQQRNKHILLSFNIDDMILSDYQQDEVKFKKDINILYKTQKQPVMLKYNQDLIKHK